MYLCAFFISIYSYFIRMLFVFSLNRRYHAPRILYSIHRCYYLKYICQYYDALFICSAPPAAGIIYDISMHYLMLYLPIYWCFLWLTDPGTYIERGINTALQHSLHHQDCVNFYILYALYWCVFAYFSRFCGIHMLSTCSLYDLSSISLPQFTPYTYMIGTHKGLKLQSLRYFEPFMCLFAVYITVFNAVYISIMHHWRHIHAFTNRRPHI